MCSNLLEYGETRETRGHHCVEIPYPVLICINNPTDRYVTIPERKWNKVLPFAESLWLALGLNDLDELPGNYVKNLYNFSDNGRTWRAGYGPRMRYFSGHGSDYDISKRDEAKVYSGDINHTDQLKFVIDTLNRDINSRQAIITIHDPAKDDFDRDGGLKVTKDQPCTRSIHFQVNTKGELDCIVDIRSNDVLWGFSAVNVINFAIMQEYVANIMGLPIGKYYHFAHNFHYYEDFESRVVELRDVGFSDPNYHKESVKFQYKDPIGDLENFDFLLDLLFDYEKSLREGYSLPCDLGNDMFNDWAKVFYNYWTKQPVYFENPHLNKLFNI